MDKADELTNLISGLTKEEQWDVIYRLLHERFGENPQQGVALTDADGKTYLFVVPPHLMEMTESNEPMRRFGTQTVSSRRFLDVLKKRGTAKDIVNHLNDLESDKRSI